MTMKIPLPLARPQFVQDMDAPKAAMTIQTTAPQLLNKAASIMQARAATYDKPEGERSMAATVTAFNAVSGQHLSEAHGWLLMAILKMVRDNQRPEAHQDSCEDLVAYASLYGEARLK